MFRLFSLASPSVRFSAPTAARVYAVQVRWLFAALVSVILLLVVALFLLANQTGGGEAQHPNQPIVAAGPRPASILVSKQRIEEGMRITGSMLENVEMSPSVVPFGSIPPADLTMITGRFTTRMIAPGTPLTYEMLTTNPPIDELPIPPGHRAVTVPIDELSSNGYQIRPNQRVDLILSHTEADGRPAVTPVVRMVKVLTIGTGPQAREQTGARTATLLVTIDDALRVELAKKLGSLSLVLASQGEVPSGGADPAVPCNESCLFRRAQAVPQLADAPGKMWSTDPHTHLPVCYELRGRRWSICHEG